MHFESHRIITVTVNQIRLEILRNAFSNMKRIFLLNFRVQDIEQMYGIRYLE